jgi:hypothetical protein
MGCTEGCLKDLGVTVTEGTNPKSQAPNPK